MFWILSLHFKSAKQIVILTTSVLARPWISKSKLRIASYPLVVPLCHSLYISIVIRNHVFKQVSQISYVILKAVIEAECNVLLPDKALLIIRCSSGKMLGLLFGQLYVGPNGLWAPFVTVIVQLMYCSVLFCVVALQTCIPHVCFFPPPRLTC